MKKILQQHKKIFVILVLLVLGVAVVCFINSVKTPSVLKETVSNGTYVIKYQINSDNPEGLEYITFYVEDESGKQIYSCPNNWRTFDFKGVSFIDGTNDILVSSGDIGDTTYIYNEAGKTWVEQEPVVFNEGTTGFFSSEEESYSETGYAVESEMPSLSQNPLTEPSPDFLGAN